MRTISAIVLSLLAMVGLAVTTSPGAAQQCYSYSQPYSQSYYQPYTTVVRNNYVPIAVPVAYPTVAVPIYSYTNLAYGYPAVQAYGNTAFPPGYGMAGYPGAAAQSGGISVDAIADAVIKRLSGGNGNGAVTPTGPPPMNGGPPAVAAPNAGNVVALLTEKCANCHSGAGAKGKPFFNDQKQLIQLSREQRFDIFDRVDDTNPSFSMPKGGPPLTNEQVEIIRLWARQK